MFPAVHSHVDRLILLGVSIQRSTGGTSLPSPKVQHLWLDETRLLVLPLFGRTSAVRGQHYILLTVKYKDLAMRIREPL